MKNFFLSLFKIVFYSLLGVLFFAAISLVSLNNKSFSVSNEVLQKLSKIYDEDIFVEAKGVTLSIAGSAINIQANSINSSKQNKNLNFENFSLNFNVLKLNGNIEAKIIDASLFRILAFEENKDEKYLLNNEIICSGLVNINFNLFGYKSAFINLKGTNGWYDPKINNISKIDLKNFILSASSENKIVTINQFLLEYANGSKAFLSKPALLTLSSGEIGRLDLHGEVLNFPSEILKAIWPVNIVSDVRLWVLENINKGLINKAKVDLDFNQAIEFKDSINIEIAFEGVEVRYLEEYKPISDVNGVLKIDGEALYLKAKTGDNSPFSLEDIELKINYDDWNLDYKSSLKGQIFRFAQFIPQEALKKLLNFNIDFADIKGDLKGDLHLNLPLKEGLSIGEIKLSLSTELSQVVLDKKGFLNFKKGEFKILNEPNKMNFHLTSEGFLDLEFDVHNEEESTKDDKLVISMDIATKEKISFQDKFSIDRGQIKPVVTIIDNKWDAVIDLKDAEVNFSTINYHNPISLPLLIGCSGTIEEGDIVTSENCNISGKNAQGGFSFVYSLVKENLIELNLNEMKFGPNDFSFHLGQEDEIFNLNIDARYLDLTNFKPENFSSSNNKENYNIQLNIKKALMPNKNYLNDIVAKISKHNKKPISIDLSAFGNNKDEKVKISKIKKENKYGYILHALPAGVFAQDFGVYKNMKRGEIWIEGFPELNANKELFYRGEVRLNKFALSNTSAFTKIVMGILSPLNSPLAIAETLKGGSLQVDSLDADLEYKNGVLLIASGIMKASTYELKFSGTIDLNKKQLHIKGLYIPSAYGLNTLVSNIPFFGKILSGGKNSAFIGSSFTIKGDLSDTKVSFNPLTSLVPGIFRNLFN